MFRQISDQFEINDPNDKNSERAKEEALKKLNANPRAVLSIVMPGGSRIEVSLKDFMDKYGDPGQYKPDALKKYVYETWIGKGNR